ncbi:hypothetical protein LSAT2_031570 [Lamellibrachia satsuma]|nr:hypothetical protein LSAT2_031570 [Lamellibrachia satsuma]
MSGRFANAVSVSGKRRPECRRLAEAADRTGNLSLLKFVVADLIETTGPKTVSQAQSCWWDRKLGTMASRSSCYVEQRMIGVPTQPREPPVVLLLPLAYVLHTVLKSSVQRTCTEQGEWNGTDVSCVVMATTERESTTLGRCTDSNTSRGTDNNYTKHILMIAFATLSGALVAALVFGILLYRKRMQSALGQTVEPESDPFTHNRSEEIEHTPATYATTAADAPTCEIIRGTLSMDRPVENMINMKPTKKLNMSPTQPAGVIVTHLLKCPLLPELCSPDDSAVNNSGARACAQLWRGKV